jgi:hypothetical protein
MSIDLDDIISEWSYAVLTGMSDINLLSNLRNEAGVITIKKQISEITPK